MAKKQTIEDIYKWVKENSIGIQCLSKEYIKNEIELLFICNKGHTFRKTINNFKKHPNCPHCTGKYKYTYEDVKKYIESVDGYKLLSENYINCKENLKIQCDNNHIFLMPFNSFKNGGHRCPICNTGGKNKYDLKIARHIFKNGKCKLLATKYINCDMPMEYECECGNQSTISLKMFQSGQRCYKCRNKKIGDILRTPYKEIVKIFEDNGCKLLSKESEIQNSKTKVKYICSCGNLDEIMIDEFKSGGRCNKCKKERVENTFLKKYGFKYALSHPNIREKIRQTLYKNGTAPCSQQQEYLYNLLGGELNYPVKTSSLDIAFPEEMIYLEYDGGLHEGQVIFGNITKEEFIKRERNRTYGLLRSGWKEIRIISKNDQISSDSKLLEMIDYAKEYLNQNHHYIKFDIDNKKIINSQGEFDYDYGELRKISSKDLQKAI